MSDDKEIPLDIKDDIKSAFNLYKNENNKINKLKLRTILFSFVMYKFSASDINDFIDSRTLKDKELYTFDDLCDLVKEKLYESRERDADELYDYIISLSTKKNSDKDKNKEKNKDKNKDEKNKTEKGKNVTKEGLIKAFESATIDIKIDEKDIDKMLEYMNGRQNEQNEENENLESEKLGSEKTKDEGEEGEKKDEKNEVKQIKINKNQFRQFYVEQK